MEWTDNERSVIDLLMVENDLSERAVLRGALRLYELRHNAIKAGFPNIIFCDYDGNQMMPIPPPMMLSYD